MSEPPASEPPDLSPSALPPLDADRERSAAGAADAAPASPASPGEAPPPPVDHPGESGFTLRAVSFGFVLLLAWVFVINSGFPDNFYRLQQLVMLMGFGALLTLFFVKFMLGLLPVSMRLRPPETAVFFTILLIGIPSAMMGRLALESAYINHLPDVGVSPNLSGQLGMVPAPWAPEAHVRMPEHRTMVAPLSAAELSAVPARAASVARASRASVQAEVFTLQVLMDYEFAQKPALASQWLALTPLLKPNAAGSAWPVLQAEYAPAEASALQDRPAFQDAEQYLLLLRNLNAHSRAPEDPAWRLQAAAFKDAFDRESAEARDIFAPLIAVTEDAKSFARYAGESDRSPRIAQERAKAYQAALDAQTAHGAAADEAAAKAAGDAAAAPVPAEEAFRGALATESCAARLQVARGDIQQRLGELAANYAAVQGLYKGEAHPTHYDFPACLWMVPLTYGALVPWRLWIVPMAYWAAVMLAFHGLAFAFLLAMRKVWVEAERLPFPYTILPERVERGVPLGVDQTGVPAEQSVFPRWWLFIPFLVGFGLCLPHFIDINEHVFNLPPPNPLNNTKDLSVAGWDIRLNFDTWTLALLLLFPLDLLFTAVFFFFIGAYAVPYVAKLCGVEGFGQNLIPYQMLRMGGFLGLFLGTVWFNRRTMWQLVSGRRPRVGASGTGAEHEAAGRDPLPPMLVTGIFWTCLIGLSVLLLWGETGGGFAKVVLLLFGLFVVVVYNFQEWRIRAEGGFVAWDFNNVMKVQSWSNWYAFGLHHTNPDPVTQLPLPPSQMAWQQLYNTGLLGTYVPTLGPGAYFLEAFRIGDLFRASPKAILKAALLAFLFALLVGMPIYLACTYHYGLYNESMGGSWANFGHTSDKIFRYYMKRSDGGPFGTASSSLSGLAYLQDLLLGNNWRNTVLWSVAGAACVIVLMYYRRNMARFPFNPVGFVIAGTGSSGTGMDMGNIWFAFLVAFLIKWLIHDWFGVRVFRTKVEPGITYLILGLCSGILVYVVLVVLRLHYGVTFLEHHA